MVKSVLVVDDSPVVRRSLCKLFKYEKGFEVCGEAATGEDAIDKAQTLRPDLIVLDLSMPGMDGLEAARVLKQMMPSVPMILYSSYLDQATGSEALNAGVSAVVSKADQVETLIQKARSLVDLAS